MRELFLIKPTVDLEKEYLDMLNDWKIYDESNISWFIKLDKIEFHKMVEKLNELSIGIGVEDGFVENTTYWLADINQKIIGAINIRHRLNDFYLNYGGQVGYGVRPSERGKGYAKEMLRLCLEICKQMGFDKVLLCCNKNNVGSVKTIIDNGGILDSEGIFNDQIIQRYWINLV